MLKNAILDAKFYENFAKIWRNFDKIRTKFWQILLKFCQNAGLEVRRDGEERRLVVLREHADGLARRTDG